MKYANKFKAFLTDLANQHGDKAFFEGISQAFDAIFEADKLGIDPNPSDKSGLGLHSRSDYTPADIAKAKNRGEYGNLVDHNKESRHKGMVGDSFVGHTGTSKSQEIAKRAQQSLETKSDIIDPRFVPIANVMNLLFGGDIGNEFGGINTGNMESLKGTKYNKLGNEETIAKFAAAKLKEALPYIKPARLKKLINAEMTDVIDDAKKIGIDKQTLINAVKNNSENSASVNEIIKTKLIPVIQDISKITNADIQGEIQQGYEQYQKYEPSGVDNISTATKLSMEDIWTRGAKVNQIAKAARQTGVNKMSATKENENRFIQQLMSEGYSQDDAESINTAMKETKRILRDVMIRFAQRKQGAPANETVVKKLAEYYNGLQQKGQSEGDPNKYIGSYVKWPFTGKGSHQSMVKTLKNYVDKDVDATAITPMKDALAQIGMSIDDLYSMVYSPLFPDNAEATFNSIKSAVEANMTDPSQKETLKMIDVDDKAFADLLPAKAKSKQNIG